MHELYKALLVEMPPAAFFPFIYVLAYGILLLRNQRVDQKEMAMRSSDTTILAERPPRVSIPSLCSFICKECGGRG